MRNVRRIHRGTSSPGPIDTSYFVDGLRFVRSLFSPGMWVSTEVPTRCSYYEWESAHMQVTGLSHEVNGKLPVVRAGWMSRTDDYVMDPGVYTRVFDDPSEYWCGLWTESSGCAHLESMALAPGESWTPMAGTKIFLVHGSASGLRGPMQITATGLRPLKAETDTFLYYWTPLPKQTVPVG